MSERFLIEVAHENTMGACLHAIEVFHKTGSHFLTHADWGCKDGVHKAWIMVDVDSESEARGIVPPAFRSVAKIVGVTHFTLAEIEPALRKLEERARRG